MITLLRMLTEEERRELVGMARGSISRALQRRYAFREIPPAGDFLAPSAGVSEGARGRLAEPGGAFVTLRIGHELRGCIGYIESNLPLAKVVQEVAEKAAFEDPRFPPLSPAELGQITVEVSVLSPLHLMTTIDEIQVGVHGILLELGRYRGLLLPQVATEYRWDTIQFLENTARKAGLPKDAWKDPGAQVYLFSAEIVQEVGDE